MEKSECYSCRKPKAPFECEVCHEAFCKNCSQVLDESTFKFLPVKPEMLSHSIYCGGCFDQEVAPALEAYEQTVEQAKEAFVFFKTGKRRIPLIRKGKVPYRIPNCQDRDETIFRLAFLAVQDGFNAITEVEVVSKKVRNEGYQTSTWSGTAIPAEVDAEKMDRDDQLDRIYR
jgi:hypothetical protein